jgi:hypothetical protein
VIVHVATARGITALRNTKRRGQSLGADVLPVLYDEIPDRTVWPRGVYLFSDMQRATPWQRLVAEQLWSRLAERPDAFRAFNHPTHCLRRYGLLRALYEHGINGFNAYTLDELPTSVRYPVFVRYEDQHIGPSTGLLADEAELERALAALLVEGHRPERLIVVEFQDTACRTGIYRKYGAFRLGERVYTGHMMASTDWSVKREINDRVLVGTEDLDYVKTNPHAEQIMAAFQVAGLTWGRIDYGVLDGRIQVWEINDNPKLGSSLFKRTMGRKLARKVTRKIRLNVFRDELSRIVPGPPIEIPFDFAAFSGRVASGEHAGLEEPAVLRLES